MYETVKELHIEIEQRIQQITSNRHRSIAPQFIDMMLNRAAVKYIQTKSNRKTNYKGEGLEDSKKRVDDIQSLKRETPWLKLKRDKQDADYPNRAFVILPGDYLKLISSTSRLTYGKARLVENLHEVYPDDEVKNLYYHLIDLSKIALTGDEFNGQIIVNGNEIDISDILSLYDSDSDKIDLYEIAGLTCDRLRQALSNKYNVYWENLIGRYYKDCIIITSNAKDEIALKVNDIDIPVITYNTTYDEFVNVGNKFSENDLIATENIRGEIKLSDNTWNTLLNKITFGRFFSATQKVTIAGTDDSYSSDGFNLSEDAVKISYIKKPRLFNIDINQMSDMEVTPDFIDSVVSDILLVLKDDSFSAVKQQSNLE